MFEPSDLLARFDARSYRLIPHSGGLLDLLLDKSDSMRIAVLDGFNRAAVDSYLIPLLQCAQDVALGRKARSIPLSPPGFASEDDPYGGISRVRWSHNVLLVLCPSTGVSTLPIPAEFWAYCTAIDASEPAPVPPVEGGSPGVTKVPAPVWKAWSQSAKEKSEPLEILRKLSTEAGPVPPVVLGNVENIYGSGKVLGVSRERALEQAIKTGLLPYMVSTDHWDVLSEYFGIDSKAAHRKLGDAVRQLGE